MATPSSRPQEPTPHEASLSRDLYHHYLQVLDQDLRPFAERHVAGWGRA